MSKIEYVKGDLIEMIKKGEVDIAIHGCNCFNTMGAGIAAQLRKNFPQVYYADTHTNKSPIDKFADFSSTLVLTEGGKQVEIINAYTQYMPGPNFNLEAWIVIMQKILFLHIEQGVNTKQIKIGLPKIGCGIGGGDWDKVGKSTELLAEYYNVVVVEYEKE